MYKIIFILIVFKKHIIVHIFIYLLFILNHIQININSIININTIMYN